MVDAVVASAAVPGLLPPAKVGDEHFLDGGIVNSVPVGRAVQLGATRVFVLQVGRVDRPLSVPRRPWEVARVSFEIARRHRFVREMAELPDGVEAHVLPARGTSSRDDTLLGSRDFGSVQQRIDDDLRGLGGLPRGAPAHPGPAMIRLLRRVVLAPAVVLLTVVLWVTLPLWLIAAAALSPVLPGRWRALRLLWVVILYLTCEALLLVVLLGLWLASGFGWRIRTPYFEGIHYDLVQGVTWVFFREARRVLRLRITTDGPAPDAHPGIPLLVCCRHAGPGDSFTLIYALMHWYSREPRVVLKDTLAWDPAIDVLLGRIPARFISTNPGPGEDLESHIAALASRPRRERRVRDLPRGRELHPGTASARHRPAAPARDGADGASRREDDERAGAAARAASWPRSTPPPTPTSCWSPTPGWTTCAPSPTCGGSCRWTSRSSCGGGRCRAPRSPRGARRGSTGSTRWWERIDTWVEENRPEDLSSGRSAS